MPSASSAIPHATSPDPNRIYSVSFATNLVARQLLTSIARRATEVVRRPYAQNRYDPVGPALAAAPKSGTPTDPYSKAHSANLRALRGLIIFYFTAEHAEIRRGREDL